MLNSDIAAFREDLLARDKASMIEFITTIPYSIQCTRIKQGRFHAPAFYLCCIPPLNTIIDKRKTPETLSF